MKKFILYLIFLVISACNYSNERESKNAIERDILNTLNILNIKYDSTAVYFLIPSNTCYGCSKHTINVLNEYSISKQVIVISSDLSLSQIHLNKTKIYIDKKRNIDRTITLKEKITIYDPSNKKIKQFNQLTIDSLQYYIKSLNHL